MYTCPECGRKTEVYSRITGYYRPVQNWNDGKTEEFKNRRTYVIETSKMRRKSHEEEIEENGVVEASNEMADKLLLFTTSTCPNCKMAKAMLKNANIDYVSIDAEENIDTTVKFGVKKAPTLLVPTPNGYEYFDNASEIKRYIESTRK